MDLSENCSIMEHEELPGNSPDVALPVVPVKAGWVLQKLTTRHKRIVAAKAAGLSRSDIARLCNCTPEYVSMLLQQKLIQDYLTEQHIQIDQDMRDLMGPAVEAIRETLDSPDDKVRLSAAALVLKTNGKLGSSQGDDANLTAEDVVAKLFSIANSNVQINLGVSDANEKG
jgi:DNA-binding transcriptional MerR regulator